MERNHHVILGWSDVALPLIQEFALDAEDRGGCKIVVMADMSCPDMVEMVGEMKDLRGTDVICRYVALLAAPAAALADAALAGAGTRR